MYTVKEIFKTLQGEGAQAGRASVFCRFAGCNLACSWCDTDFIGGTRYADAEALADAIEECWGHGGVERHVVFTGGEPLLQLDASLLKEVRSRMFRTAIETNGTLPVPPGVDWICVSPKAGSPLIQKHGRELKVVYPQPGIDPDDLLDLDFDHLFIQPMDGPDRAANTAAAVAYCLEHPHWRLSLQTHKFLGIR